MEEKKVTIYTTPTCVYCKEAKSYFEESGVAYEEINVAEDLEAQQSMVQKSGQMAVPVIDVGGEIVVGFNKDKLAELLGK
jgi:glutaredoxin 3